MKTTNNTSSSLPTFRRTLSLLVKSGVFKMVSKQRGNELYIEQVDIYIIRIQWFNLWDSISRIQSWIELYKIYQICQELYSLK